MLAGIRNMDDIANTKLPLDKDYQFKSPSPGAVAKVEIAVRRYQDEMLLTKWLQDHSLEKYLDRYLVSLVFVLLIDVVNEHTDLCLVVLLNNDVNTH